MRGSVRYLAIALMTVSVIGQASADSESGSITGRVVVCREDFAPVADASTLLEDVPSTGGGRPTASVPLPVPEVLVALDGTDLATRTDSAGHFALSGVPTDRPLRLNVLSDPNAAPVAQATDLLVAAGQTLDVGALGINADGCPALPPSATG